MLDNVINILKETRDLITENDNIYSRVKEALEIIEAIKQGNVDAVFVVNKETAKIMVPKTADQTYRKFIENMQEGVVTLLDDGTILYSNLSFSKIVGKPLEKIIGSNLRSYIPSAYIETFERFFDGLPEENLKIELSICDEQGNSRFYVVSINKLPLQNITALNLVWSDITELINAKDELVNANQKLQLAVKQKILSETKAVSLNKKLVMHIEMLNSLNAESETFADFALYDLQEPVRKLSTYSSILASDYFTNMEQEGRQYMEIIFNASVQLRSVLEDILDYSNLSKNVSLFSLINLNSIVKEVFVKLAGLIEETNALITIEKELPSIIADPQQIFQLFQQMLSNFLKSKDPGIIPDITIKHDLIKVNENPQNDSAQSVRDFCRICIRSNGIGMKVGYHRESSPVFKKINNSTYLTSNKINLAICKKIVELHYGSITAEVSVENGSLVTVILPVTQL